MRKKKKKIITEEGHKRGRQKHRNNNFKNIRLLSNIWNTYNILFYLHLPLFHRKRNNSRKNRIAHIFHLYLPLKLSCEIIFLPMTGTQQY